MYSKKYRLEKVEEFNKHNPTYENAKSRICYLAYLNIGECGWFLLESNDWFGTVHRIRTSTIKNVEYVDDQVIVTTQNTKLTFILAN